VLIGEPVRSQGDLVFQIGGIPVRVTPWFWIMSVMLGWNVSDNGNPHRLVTWVLAVFASILIHELGHAWAFRYYGSGAHIVLYQFGGLAIPNSFGNLYGRQRNRNSLSQIAISAAGPGAQLLAAALLIVVVRSSGHGIPLDGFIGDWLDFPSTPRLESTHLFNFVDYFLYASIYWAIMNLLPVFPLDGGQIARELFVLSGRSVDAIKHSLMLSFVTAVVVATYRIMHNDTYMGIMFGMLAYSSYQALQPFVGSGSGHNRPW